MAYDAGYPGNRFRQGGRSTLFGGATASEFGGPAWLRLNGLVHDIETWLLDFFHRSASTQVCKVQEAVTVGDSLFIDFALSATDADGYTVFYVRRLPSGSGALNAFFLGIALETAAAGEACHYAVGGMLPANMFAGLAGLAPGSRLTTDEVTGRLRAWTAGGDVHAYSGANGAVMLLFPGRVA